MANNPFDPPIIQVKKTLERGGLAGANKGFGSVRSSSPPSRPAPGPQALDELDDVDVTGIEDGQVLVWDETAEMWLPGEGGGGGGGGGSIEGLWDLGVPSTGATGQPQAMKGAIARIGVAARVTRIEHEVVSVTAGRTYRLGVYRLNENRDEIVEVVGEADHVAVAGETWLGADVNAELEPGFWYLFACRDTTGGNLMSRFGSGREWPGIGLGEVWGGRGTAVPAVGASVQGNVDDTYSMRVGFKIVVEGDGGGSTGGTVFGTAGGFSSSTGVAGAAKGGVWRVIDPLTITHIMFSGSVTSAGTYGVALFRRHASNNQIEEVLFKQGDLSFSISGEATRWVELTNPVEPSVGDYLGVVSYRADISSSSSWGNYDNNASLSMFPLPLNRISDVRLSSNDPTAGQTYDTSDTGYGVGIGCSVG